jgi:hypothetical protein
VVNVRRIGRHHAEISHLCNVEDHPLPSKSGRGVAEHLIPRISSEFASMAAAPALVETLKSTEGTKPWLKTVYSSVFEVDAHNRLKRCIFIAV